MECFAEKREEKRKLIDSLPESFDLPTDNADMVAMLDIYSILAENKRFAIMGHSEHENH